MTSKTKLAIAIAIFLWSSAFVGIRAGLQDYSPEGLALLRYLIASLCMGVVYFRLPERKRMPLKDAVKILAIGAIGIGVYNVTLNYGELNISSGMASFITSQSPIITTIVALLFLGEELTFHRILGLIISLAGVSLIAVGESDGFTWNTSLGYILFATLAGGCYSVLQKPFFKKYHAIQATAFAIWGGTLFLMLYYPHLNHDIHVASFKATLTVIYLGIFPAAVGYVAWGYVLTEIPASRAVSFLYFSPFVATLLGWAYLKEVPVWVSIAGGILAVLGVWVVNQSYPKRVLATET